MPLPKAVRARCDLSMTLAEALATLGVFGLLSRRATRIRQRERALTGQHWMLTPWTRRSKPSTPCSGR